MPRPSLPFLVALVAAAIAASFSMPVAAVGLGNPELRSHLGEPLQLALPLRIAPGEGFSDDCVRVAPARDGDVPTVYGARARVVRNGGLAEVVVTSADVISEPVLRVVVEAGCTASISRDVVLLLDPPAHAGNTMPGVVEGDPARSLPPRHPASGEVAGAEPSSADAATVAAIRPRPSRPPRSARPALAAPAATPSSAAAAAGAASSLPARAPSVAPASGSGPRMRLEDPIAAQSVARLPEAAAAVAATPGPTVPQPTAQEVELINKLTALGEQIEALKRQVAEQAAMNAQLRTEQDRMAPKEALYALGLLAAAALLAVVVMAARLRAARRTVPTHAWWAETRLRGDPSTLMRPPAIAPAAQDPPSAPAPTGPTASGADPDVFYPAGTRTDPAVRHDARLARAQDARIEVEELGATQAMKVLNETQTTMAITSNFEPAVRAAAAKHAAQAEAIHALDFDLGEPVETAPGDEIREVDIALDAPPAAPQSGPSEFVPPALHQSDGRPLSRVEARQVQAYLRQTADAIEQADAYLSAGQSESAASVLRRLIQDREGTPRAPWLMLLQIYRRGDKQDAYEGLAQKFGAQFGRMPPPWDLAEKNPTEPGLDSDPQLLQAIWTKWGSPDSMSLLSRLLYERDADNAAFFNLTLQRDLLNFVKICPLDDS